MHPAAILRLLGLLLIAYSGSLLLPVLVALIHGERELGRFLYSFLIILATGVACWLPVQHRQKTLRVRDGYILVVAFWVVLGGFGALPYTLTDNAPLSLTDAVFESVSGFTTTGATVFTQIDLLPKSLLYYRQQQQWLGGMGIIVLVVAILPLLGVGGMQMHRAETSGTVMETKLTPRMNETARALWLVYVSLTALCALAYWLAGMSFFDAVCHAFSTLSLGGFSTHTANFAYFENGWLEAVAILFMLLAGMNVGLHFLVWRRRSLRVYFNDGEVRFYFLVLGALALLTIGGLWLSEQYDSFGASVRHGLFAAVSVITTGGFSSAAFSTWHPMLALTLVFASFIGACAGSTSGGIKMVRANLMIKQGLREMRRLLQPNAVILIKFSGRAVPDRLVEAVWGFFGIYLLTFCVLFIALLLTGLDFLSGFSAVAACLNNAGPGLGAIAGHYGDLDSAAKWILCVAMLLGRLEIFTLLVMFTPMFWRH